MAKRIAKAKTTDLTSNRGWLAKMGCLGMASKEPLIMAALLARKPIIFSGQDGTGKTQIAEALTESCYGPQSFRLFHCPTTTQEAFVGHLDMRAYQKGHIKYLRHAGSIWGANGVLFDEGNRVHPSISAMFYEAANSRTINGQELDLEFVFLACNPPALYHTEPMDKAFVGRFVTIEVPSLEDMLSTDPSDEFAALTVEDREIDAVNYQNKWSSVNKAPLNEEQMVFCSVAAQEVVRKLVELGTLRFNIRHSKAIARLFAGLIKWHTFTKEENLSVFVERAKALALGTVAECSGLVDEALWVDPATISQPIEGALQGIVDKIESVKSQKELNKLLSSDTISAQGLQRLLDHTTPEGWSEKRSKVKKTALWGRVNSIMAARSLANEEIDVTDLSGIWSELDAYRNEEA